VGLQAELQPTSVSSEVAERSISERRKATKNREIYQWQAPGSTTTNQQSVESTRHTRCSDYDEWKWWDTWCNSTYRSSYQTHTNNNCCQNRERSNIACGS